MKKIGILGGMSWPSTIEYYRIINQRVNEALGGNHSAQIILYSVDFAAVEKMQKAGRWEELGCRTDRTSQRQKSIAYR